MSKVVRIPSREDLQLGSRVAEVLGESERLGDIFGEFSSKETGNEPRIKSRPRAGSGEAIAEIPIEQITYNPQQTRKIKSDAELEGLSKSLESKGIIQPIIVRLASAEAQGEARYELVAGERRLRAAALAGLSTIPAIVRDLNDRDAVELAVVENAQRENLNPIEEALAYRCLLSQFKLTQTEVADIVGKNRSTISNAVRLLQLDSQVISMLESEQLSAGHGRALLMLEDSREQLRFAKRAVENSLSVHTLESLISRFLDREQEEEDELSDDQVRALATLKRQQEKISNLLGLEEVTLKVDSQGKKRLNLVFDTESSWKRFVAKVRA